MRRILLGLVVFVSYLIQAQDDFEERGFTFNSEIQEELNGITNETLRIELQKSFLRVFRMGYMEGHMEGYASAKTIKHFMVYFECAINSLKAALEVGYELAELGIALISVKENTNCEHLDFPSDILKRIRNNDEWVRLYNDEPISVVLYEAEIKKSFENWYRIISREIDQLTPPFIADIQAALKMFHEKNSANKKFETIMDVKARFAAHMARSYKMMCALHHHLNKLRSYAEKNPETGYLEILLKYAPDWHMSPEQFQFLNILRQALPNKLTSLNYIDVQNKKKEWVVIPYDPSKGYGRLMRKELPSTPNDLVTPISIAIVMH